jgi:pimeloyl-ACP methyl ester carboxylesterase
MPAIKVGDVELFYELRRKEREDDEQNRPLLLLIMGLGGQMTSWDQGFCDSLVDFGFDLLLFDNRDTGLSTSFDSSGLPSFEDLFTGKGSPPYSIEDLAADAAGLLDALGVEQAHVLGISMGGMIAQALAISRPDLVQSLCSIMSTTGAPNTGMPTDEAIEALIASSPADREGYVDHSVVLWKVLGSPGFAFDEPAIRAKAAAGFDRSFRPDGVSRQFAAIIGARDRTPGLEKLSMPTLVVHGDEDKLMTPGGGVATAKAVPGAKLMKIPGMGHDLPPAVWHEVAEAVAMNAGIGDET